MKKDRFLPMLLNNSARLYIVVFQTNTDVICTIRALLYTFVAQVVFKHIMFVNKQKTTLLISE